MIAVGTSALTLATAGALTGCGGARQDAKEPSGNFALSVTRASFPASQSLAQPETMIISVKNMDHRTVPDLAVTVKSFSYVSQQAGLADPGRPVWIVDQGPAGGESAYTNTWTLGALAPGRVRTFEWHVTPVVGGTHRIDYQIAAGLNGKARARVPGGHGPPGGSFTVSISNVPAQVTVDPNTGQVIRRAPKAGSGSGASNPTGPPAANHGSQGSSAQQSGSGSGSSPNAGAGSQSAYP